MPPNQNPQNPQYPQNPAVYPNPADPQAQVAQVGQAGLPSQTGPISQPGVPIPPDVSPSPGYGQPQPSYQPAVAGQPGPITPAQPLSTPGPQIPPLLPMNNRPVEQSTQESGTPYDFFLDPQTPPKKKLVPTVGGMSGFTKLLIGAGLFVVILGITAIILSASRASKDASSTGLLAVAQSQQEIIRVNTNAAPTLQAPTLQNFASTAVPTLTTSQQGLITLASKAGTKIGTKELDLTKNAQTDKVFDAARAASTYDATFKSTMQGMLTDYEAKLQANYKQATKAVIKDALEKDYNSAKLLEQMLNQ